MSCKTEDVWEEKDLTKTVKVMQEQNEESQGDYKANVGAGKKWTGDSTTEGETLGSDFICGDCADFWWEN